MSLNIVIALMISIIFFVVVFALKLELNRTIPRKPPSELVNKITGLFRNTAIAIGGIIIFFSLAFGLDVTSENDISGWVTLVISTGIGIAIAMSVGIYSTYSQKETSSIIKQIAIDKTRRQNFAIGQLHSELIRMHSVVIRTNDIIANYKVETNKTMDEYALENIKSNTKLWLKNPNYDRNECVHSLENIIGFSNDVLDPSWIVMVQDVIKSAKIFPILGDEWKDGRSFALLSEISPGIIKNIENLRNVLPNSTV